jgi:uncharacterized protein (DUF927 family)
MAAVTDYGIAGPEFVRGLLSKDAERAVRDLRIYIDDFVRSRVPSGADGQVIRAAQRLGLIGAAGELARGLGICPWQEGAAFEAATWALQRWIENRGGADSTEGRQAVEQVRRFVEAHGETRFEPIDDHDRAPVHNRAGWRSGSGDDREWLIPPETWKTEICTGMDPSFVARMLCHRGMLRRSSEGFSSVRKIAGSNRRVYVLTADILAGAGHD